MAEIIPEDKPPTDASIPLEAYEYGDRNFSSLDPEKVAMTIHSLVRRIGERFPHSGLYGVCLELESICRRSTERLEWISQPLWWLRILRYSLIALIALGFIVGLIKMDEIAPELEKQSFIDMVQTLEAAINDVVLISLALFFVWGLEARIKRARAMKALHEIRSIAHVIDMHQLTKDPERLWESHIRTRSSPPNRLTPFEMRRYLDYCAEMLSLSGKVAALYLRTLDDSTVVATVNEIEDLTSGLSSKIWQKIALMRPDPDA